MPHAQDLLYRDSTETASFTYPRESTAADLATILKDFKPAYLRNSNSKLQNFKNLSDNWDGYGSASPSENTIAKSLNWLNEEYDEIFNYGLFWRQPAISLSADGEVVFEWWSNNKKLTIYIGEEAMEYVRVWGANIDSEMEDGTLELGQFINLWAWLIK